MRLHVSCTTNTEKIPRYYKPKLKGTLHKWLGNYQSHDGKYSTYSISNIDGIKFNGDFGTAKKSGLKFFISSIDKEFIKKIILGIKKDNTMFSGITVDQVSVEADPVFDKKIEHFFVDSPVLVKRDNKYFFAGDKKADEYMTDLMNKKLKAAGYDDEVQIMFDPHYKKSSTTEVKYRDIRNICSICPVYIKGTPEAIAFAWNVGIGNSTGIGLGAISK
ncbi:CRISPR-associated endoribonuclease Cas6 [Flammeovirga agarivorans]|uniref:CRISPR-associated endoribonuclease Cas6 n=1 Tax=Flammeovirga agarivorans TaxID=2726742 RepID=A0A7X8SPQ3_9BACT|nr:CRISPR-associated endoribonuclease Cas6 [Flammeovirga agarivorans]NLR94047.1 CRISPR-associated endoribonuclease Cas6 [Flammeovirga agarivorans]